MEQPTKRQKRTAEEWHELRGDEPQRDGGRFHEALVNTVKALQSSEEGGDDAWRRWIEATDEFRVQHDPRKRSSAEMIAFLTSYLANLQQLPSQPPSHVPEPVEEQSSKSTASSSSHRAFATVLQEPIPAPLSADPLGGISPAQYGTGGAQSPT